MLRTLAVIVLIDSVGLNPGVIITPLARTDSVRLAWDGMSAADQAKIDGFILHSSADSTTFAPVDTIVGPSQTRHTLVLPAHGQWLYLTSYDSTGQSGPSNVVYLEPVASTIRYFRPIVQRPPRRPSRYYFGPLTTP